MLLSINGLKGSAKNKFLFSCGPVGNLYLSGMSTPTATIPAAVSPSAVITWETKKTPQGFTYRIYAVEYAKPTTTIVQSSAKSSRAIASAHAKKACRFYKAQQAARRA